MKIEYGAPILIFIFFEGMIEIGLSSDSSTQIPSTYMSMIAFSTLFTQVLSKDILSNSKCLLYNYLFVFLRFYLRYGPSSYELFVPLVIPWLAQVVCLKN